MPGALAASPPEPSVVLVGNSNVGKSALFGALTGRYATVSNYPGTTVEVTSGWTNIPRHRARIVDTPGAASLLPTSQDERVTRDILISEGAQQVVVVGDTELDVDCARAHGFRAVAVLTGWSSREALEAAGPDALLGDFSDLAATLRALGL